MVNTERNFAFQQVHTDYPLFKEEVKEWVEEQDTDQWRITFADGSTRTTGMGGIAYYAEHFDDDAEVAADG